MRDVRDTYIRRQQRTQLGQVFATLFCSFHVAFEEQLDFYHLSLLDDGMRGILLGCMLWGMVVLPSSAGAVTPAPALTDREIAERLTRLETRLDEGLTGLRSDIAQLRAEMAQLRADMQEQTRQLREDMNIRFEEHFRLMLGVLAAFAAIVAVNIGIVVWDRRTAVRPLEKQVNKLAEEVAKDDERGQTVVEVLRAIGQQNQTVAAVLRRFNLL